MIIDYFFTGRCNQTCPFCYGTPKPDSIIHLVPYYEGIPELTTPQSVELIDILAKSGVTRLNITGGEPTLREDLTIILKHAKEKGIQTYLSTNGLLLSTNPNLFKQIIEYVDILGLSIDGSTPEMNIMMGRIASHLEANLNLLRMLASIEGKRPLVKIGTIISALNEKDIINIGKLLYGEYQNCFDIWRLFQFTPVLEGYLNREKYNIDDERFDAITLETITQFPGTEISVRSNNHIEDNYLFISPTGNLEVIDGSGHKVIMESVQLHDEVDFMETLSQYPAIIEKGEVYRSWNRSIEG